MQFVLTKVLQANGSIIPNVSEKYGRGKKKKKEFNYRIFWNIIKCHASTFYNQPKTNKATAWTDWIFNWEDKSLVVLHAYH